VAVTLRTLFRYVWLWVLFLPPTHSWADHGDGSALLRMHFVDVGHGDAIWIQTPAGARSPSGLNILIDGGPDRRGSNRLLTYLQSYGLKPGSVIDYVIATHPHDDHYPGLIDVLEKYEVRNIIDSGYPEQGEDFQVFLDAAKAETVQGQRASFVRLRSQPDLPLAWGKLEARILHADRADLKGMGSEGTRNNNASIVLRLAYGSFSFLLMGDAEGKEREQSPETAHYVEELLLTKFGPGGLRSTLLKAAHHGSETGSTLPFLRAVNPDIVVIMAGRKSFRGTYLPDASVLRRYKTVRPDVVVLRTDEGDAAQRLKSTNDADGDDVLIYTDGDSLSAYRAVGANGRRRWKLVKAIP